MAKQHEAMIQTEVMKGLMISEQARPVMFKEWGEIYLALEAVKRLRSYKERQHALTLQLIPFLGSQAITDITTDDVEAYRGQRRKRNGQPVKLGTINNDHIILKHCLNIARRKGLLMTNPASLVPIPCAHNERDRVLSVEEWRRLHDAASSHLKPILQTAYHLGRD